MVLSLKSFLSTNLHPYRMDDKSTTCLAWPALVGQISHGRIDSTSSDSHLHCHHHGNLRMVLDSFSRLVTDMACILYKLP
jgi:hypothetical protein